MDTRPIGVFDSGLGGLTVLRWLKKVLPDEKFIYLGDTARVPYGTRSKETIVKFSTQDVKFLMGKGVKCVVIACNTSSALAYDDLKHEFKIPLFEVVNPAAKIAANSTRNKKVGVIGTRATIGSHAHKKAIEEIDKDILVFEKACPLFVPLIEEGEVNDSWLEELANKYLKDIKKEKVDTIILGCTHYPIIKEVIAKTVGGGVELIDAGESVSQEVFDFLSKNSMLNGGSEQKSEFYVTDLTDRFSNVAEMFLGEEINDKIEKVDLE